MPQLAPETGRYRAISTNAAAASWIGFNYITNWDILEIEKIYDLIT